MISRSFKFCKMCSPASPIQADVRTIITIANEDDLKNYSVESDLG
jgi:hypothetical protein